MHFKRSDIFLLAVRPCFCKIIRVAQVGQASPSNDSASFDEAYEDVRADSDIQFATTEFKPPETPEWWRDMVEWLGNLFSPVAQLFVAVWPVLQYVLLGLLIAGILVLLWVILAPYIEELRERRQRPQQDEEWRPEATVARRWLDEADALAGKGHFEEAVHLLLYRSIEDIERRRPELLRPSNTAREIERFDSLPDKARNMFGVIVGHVERGIFGDTPIGEEGWTASRSAYSEFALKDSWKAVVTR